RSPRLRKHDRRHHVAGRTRLHRHPHRGDDRRRGAGRVGVVPPGRTGRGVTDVQPGQQLGPETYRVTRADLVRYAGASGDFNPIHWSDRVAKSVGLPGVIAHGMYTMALAGRAVTTWCGDPGGVVEYGVRFTKPGMAIVGGEGSEVSINGVVRAVADGLAEFGLTAACGGEQVLAQARAKVRVRG